MAAALVMVSVLGSAWAMVRWRQRVLEDACADLARIALIAADHVSQTLRDVDTVLRISAQSLDHGALGTADGQAVDAILAARIASMPDVVRVHGVVGADGHSRRSSRGANALRAYTGDRNYFAYHRDHADDVVLITGPLRSRSDNQPSLYLTRRLTTADGHFAGIAYALVDPQWFADDFRAMRLEPWVRIHLDRTDGWPVAWFPQPAPPLGAEDGDTPLLPMHLSQATTLTPPMVATEDDRLVVRQAVAFLPMVIDISAPRGDVLRDWTHDARIAALGALAALLALLLMLAFLHQQFRATERTAATLRRTGQLLHTAQSVAQLGSWVWDTAQHSFTMSEQMASALRLPIARNGAQADLPTLLTSIDPADRPGLQRAFEHLRSEGLMPPIVVRARARDLRMRWLEFRGERLADPAGHGAILVGAALDITERKQAEAALQRWADAFESVGFGIVVADSLTGAVLTANPAYAALHGLSQTAVANTYLPDFYPPEELESLAAHVAQADREGKATFVATKRRSDGSRFPAEISLTTVRDAAGMPVYHVTTVIDITARRQMEDQLRQAQKMEAIGTLTGGVAHDFNNLLAIVMINLDLVMAMGIDGPTRQELLRDALAAAQSGAELTQRLLAFARRQALRPQATDLNALVRNLMRLLDRVLGKSIDVRLDCAPDLWPALVDPGQLEAAITNLATNARDAMPRGGALTIGTRNVVIDTAAADPGLQMGEYVMVEVTDTGTGIPPAIAARIFEPFFTTKEQGLGSGLGLSMVYGFVQQSGGHVAMISEEAVGTTFQLYLPRGEPDAGQRAEAAHSAALSGRGETVLLVEDDATLRQAARRQLRHLGYRVLTADTAANALVMLENEAIDLLFTDIVMPGSMDGIDLALLVRQMRPRVAVLLTSGFSHARPGADGRGLPFSVLRKPYRRAALARALRQALAAAPV